MAAIAGVEPKSQEQAAGFTVPGNVGSAASAAMGSAKAAAAGPVAGASAATPSAAGVATQPGGAVPAMPAGPAPAPIGAEAAAPKPRGESEVEAPLKEPGKKFNQDLDESGFKEEQFKNSNEPELTGTMSARDESQKKTDELITANRKAETENLEAAKGDAVGTSEAKTSAMHGTRGEKFAGVVGSQKSGKTKEEKTRDEVKQHLGEIYDRSKKRVDEKLRETDERVNAEFSKGLTAAQQAYDSYTKSQIDSTLNFLSNLFSWGEFKDRVYGEGRRRWQQTMRSAISNVADIAANGLNEAHQIAQDGAQEARVWFETQPKEKQRIAGEELANIQGKFNELEAQVQAHGEKLVADLAAKYKDALKKLDAQIEADKAANMSFWEKAAAFLKEGLAILKKLKEMLLGIASSAAEVIGSILANPGAFLDTLIAGVKGGLSAFVDNIGEHLKKGLMTWLLGQLPPGIKLPQEFDLKGIVTLGLQILGLTYENFRARAVAIVGEPIVKALETGAEVFLIFIREGPAGLFKFIGDKLTELKSIVVDGIRDLVISEVVKAGIGFIIGLLNPAGALIKIVKTIISIVQFFIQNGSRIVALIEAILGSLAAIAAGDSSGVAKKVEQALAGVIPIALGFLASLLGLGDLPAKIQGILDKIRAPINKAIDFVINLAVKLVKAAGKLVVGAFTPKKKDEKAEPDEADPKKQAQIDAGLAMIDAEELKFLEAGEIGRGEAQKVAAAVRAKHPVFKSLTVVDGGDSWDYDYVASPGKKKKGEKKDEEEGSVVIAVISTKAPRPSAVPASSIARAGKEPTPRLFERKSKEALETATGLPLEKRAKFEATTDASGRTVEAEGPAGFARGPGGLSLPKESRLFDEPKVSQTTVTPGEPIFRKPDVLLVTPEQLEPIEITLDAEMKLLEKEATEGATPHKLLQIPHTIDLLLKTFGKDTPVVYTLIVKKQVPPERIKDLELRLKALGNKIDVTIRIVKR
jgi:hypothetical protein